MFHAETFKQNKRIFTRKYSQKPFEYDILSKNKCLFLIQKN